MTSDWNLETHVLEDHQSVSVRWLSLHQSLPVRECERLLAALQSAHSDRVHALYTVDATHTPSKRRLVKLSTAAELARMRAAPDEFTVRSATIFAVQSGPFSSPAPLLAALSEQSRTQAVVSADAERAAFFNVALLSVLPAPGVCVRRALGSRKDVVHQRLETREDREQREQAGAGIDTVGRAAGSSSSAGGKAKVVKQLTDTKAIEAFFGGATASAKPTDVVKAEPTAAAAEADAKPAAAAAADTAAASSAGKKAAPVKKAKSGPMEAFFKKATAAAAVEPTAAAATTASQSPAAANEAVVGDDPKLLRTALLKETKAVVEAASQIGSKAAEADQKSTSAQKRLRKRQVVDSDDDGSDAPEAAAQASSSLPSLSRSASIMTQASSTSSAVASASIKKRNVAIADDSDDEAANGGDDDDDDGDGDGEAAETGGAETETKEAKPKKPKAPVDPNRPKKPLNALFMYRNENLERVKGENAGMSAKDVGKKLNDDWKAADEATKKKFQDQSKAALAEWKDACKKYDAELKKSKGESQDETAATDGDGDADDSVGSDSDSSEERAHKKRQKQRLPKDQLTLEHFSPKKAVQKRRRTKMVVETFADDQGYFVSREVEVTDDEASSEKPVATAPPPVAKKPGALSSKSSKADDSKSSSTSAAATKQPAKQSSLASFFGKKS
jgi:hypothetical protein